MKPDWHVLQRAVAAIVFWEIIAEALALAPLAAVFAYAAGNDAWKDQQRLEDPKVAGYFRSLARRMNREAMQFTDRRSACLN